MRSRLFVNILFGALLASCMNANLAFDGDDLLPPQLRMSEPATSGNSLDVTFEATLSETIGKEKCGFYLSMDENFASSEKVSADHIDKDKGRFSYTKRIKDYGHRWYCKAYASNGKIEIHSRVSSYLVKPFSDYVSAEVPKIVSSVDDRAELSFIVSAVEGISLTECGVCYGLSVDELSIKLPHVSSEGLAGEQTVSITGLTVGQEYYVCSYAREGENIVYSKAVSLNTVSSVPEAVDLGLSVKWASFNIGATKPEEYGGYYQWAGLEDVTSTSIYLDLDNCPYHIGLDAETGWTKYVPSSYSTYWSGSGSPDNKTVLDPNDDVARVKLGDKWRMPTDSEWTELREHCTWTWTTQNGVEGYKVTSKKSGYTSKSIFLPTAGSRYSGDFNKVGSDGYYWSSSLNTNYPYFGCVLRFYLGVVGNNYYSRSLGLSVRPVYGDRVSVTGVSLNKSSLNLNIGETSTLSATVTPSNAAEKSVSWSSSNASVVAVDQFGSVEAVKAGSATITVTTTDGGYTATCSVTVKSPEPVTPEAVDLGLSVKWASCNLGASKPEEYGGYYQWAGLEDVTNTSICLDCENCPYHTGSNSKTGWTKYVHSNKPSYWSGSGSPDNKTVLDPSDDVAHVKLGGKWRMPTDVEWTELMENCTWTCTTQNGVKGYKVTSTKSGYTSKSIFLPAAGSRFCESYEEEGSYYWSSLVGTYAPDKAKCLEIIDLGDVHMSSVERSDNGFSVRPVYGDRVNVIGVSPNKTNLSLNIGETFTLSATVIPSNAAEKSVSWSSNNTSVATVDQFGSVEAVKAGTATITVRTTDGGYTATCSVTVKSPEPMTPEAVDLGLSVKWASFNIGTTSPEGHGGHYQWAGLEDVTNTSNYLDWNNCPYHTGSDNNTGWTKYAPLRMPRYWSGPGSPDNKTVLDLSDDVAHVTLGGKWRMPTRDEWTELEENCTWTWTTQNGVNGYKVTGKKSGYTGKSIFLPAAGYRYVEDMELVGTECLYWSSSVNLATSAFCASFDPNSFNPSTISSASRFMGLSVRPVYGDKVSVTGVKLNTTALNLNIGETSTLSVTVTPSNAAEKSVSWSSSNASVVAVDQFGSVEAVKAGSATITVTTTDGGYTATCSVTVKENEPYFVVDGQSNYSVDAGGGEFQFIVRSNVEWTLKDYHDISYPWQKTTISKNGNEATVKVIIEANTEYSPRESYIKFTIPSIQDPILDENDQATGETTDHIEKVYFKQSGLANVAWETVLPSGTKRENQLSIAKGSSTYLLFDGNSFYSFNQKTGAVTSATIPSFGEEIVEITNDDAGNLLLATSTEFGKTFDIFAIPAGTSIGANTNPSLIVHSNSDINGIGPGHITARGNVFEEGIITALITCWDSVFGAYWEIEKGKATAQPQYVTINIQNLWSPLSASFSPLGISASSGFIYNGYDGIYNYVYIDKNGSSKIIGSRGDWDAGVTCLVPGYWGNESIAVANVMSYFPEQYPSYIEIYKLNSMDPVASIPIKTSNGSNNTGRSSCIMLENENGNLIIYCADGAQNVLSKITIPSR